MPTNHQSQEDNFYADLDKKTAHRSCCTCQTLIIFFAIILTISIIIVFFLVREIKKINLSPQKITTSFTLKDSFNKKIEVTDLEFTTEITSEELTSIMSDGLKLGQFDIKDIQVTVDKDGLNIYGNTKMIVKTNFKVETTPKAENGKIKIAVNKISAGHLSLPGILKPQIEKNLNEYFDNKFSNLYQNYEIEKIELQQDKIIISGKLKTI